MGVFIDLELTQPITVVAIEVPLPGSSSSAGAASKKHVSLEVKRERKAAKTLAIVTGAFIACWLPFFILALLMVIFKNFVFNHYLISFFQWMGYFNSTLNPIIYTIFSPEFRVAFKRILCGKSHVLNHRPRHLQWPQWTIITMLLLMYVLNNDISDGSGIKVSTTCNKYGFWVFGKHKSGWYVLFEFSYVWVNSSLTRY